MGGCCFTLPQRVLLLALVAVTAFLGAMQGAKQSDCCPAPQLQEPQPTPARPRVDPQAESGGQRSLVFRRRDGQWIRAEVIDGDLQESVISQGVVRPGDRGQTGGLGP